MKLRSSDLNKTIFFLGIGGSGMAPLAAMTKARGYSVCGYDSKATSIPSLTGLGISVSKEPIREVSNEIGLIVVSSAIADDHPSIKLARKANIPIAHRSELLSYLASDYQFLAVAGTHGKTTTSAILCFLLEKLGTNPSAVVGGSMKHSGTTWQNGTGPFFVGEADESDGTFLNYRQSVSVVTNIDLDHMDFYQSESRLHQAFDSFLHNTADSGHVIIGIDSPPARRLYDRYRKNKLSFGLSPDADVCAFDLSAHENHQEFKIKIGEKVVSARMRSLAKHDLLNALAAIAVISSLNLNVELSTKILADFPGVSRRLDPIYIAGHLKIIDDYAHNPGKIEASIRACKRAWSDHRVTVVFEPHRYSRINSMPDAFYSAFKEANQVLVTPVYSAGEAPIESLDEHSIAKKIQHYSSVSARSYSGPSQFNSQIGTKREKTVILFVGAGDSQKFAANCMRHIEGEIST